MWKQIKLSRSYQRFYKVNILTFFSVLFLVTPDADGKQITEVMAMFNMRIMRLALPPLLSLSVLTRSLEPIRMQLSRVMW